MSRAFANGEIVYGQGTAAVVVGCTVNMKKYRLKCLSTGVLFLLEKGSVFAVHFMDELEAGASQENIAALAQAKQFLFLTNQLWGALNNRMLRRNETRIVRSPQAFKELNAPSRPIDASLLDAILPSGQNPPNPAAPIAPAAPARVGPVVAPPLAAPVAPAAPAPVGPAVATPLAASIAPVAPTGPPARPAASVVPPTTIPPIAPIDLLPVPQSDPSAPAAPLIPDVPAAATASFPPMPVPIFPIDSIPVDAEAKEDQIANSAIGREVSPPLPDAVDLQTDEAIARCVLLNPTNVNGVDNNSSSGFKIGDGPGAIVSHLGGSIAQDAVPDKDQFGNPATGEGASPLLLNGVDSEIAGAINQVRTSVDSDSIPEPGIVDKKAALESKDGENNDVTSSLGHDALAQKADLAKVLEESVVASQPEEPVVRSEPVSPVPPSGNSDDHLQMSNGDGVDNKALSKNIIGDVSHSAASALGHVGDAVSQNTTQEMSNAATVLIAHLQPQPTVRFESVSPIPTSGNSDDHLQMSNGDGVDNKALSKNIIGDVSHSAASALGHVGDAVSQNTTQEMSNAATVLIAHLQPQPTVRFESVSPIPTSGNSDDHLQMPNGDGVDNKALSKNSIGAVSHAAALDLGHVGDTVAQNTTQEVSKAASVPIAHLKPKPTVRFASPIPSSSQLQTPNASRKRPSTFSTPHGERKNSRVIAAYLAAQQTPGARFNLHDVLEASHDGGSAAHNGGFAVRNGGSAAHNEGSAGHDEQEASVNVPEQNNKPSGFMALVRRSLGF